MFILRLSSSFTEVVNLCMQWVDDLLVFLFFRSLLLLGLLSASSNPRADVSVCPCVGEVTFSSSTRCSGVGLQSLIQWAPKSVISSKICMGAKVCFSKHSQSLLLNVHCSSFIGPTLGAKVCHQLYLTQQPVTNWAIYTRLALGWARDLHYLRGRQQCSWVFIRALDLRRREELQAISLSGVVRCWGGEFARTPIPSQFWRIQTLNLAIAFIVTPRTGLMVQLLGRWCECSHRLQ